MLHLKRWPIWILLLILFAGYACNKAPSGVSILDDFEDAGMPEIWKGTFTLSNAFPAHGKSCLELRAPAGEPLWLESEELIKEISAWLDALGEKQIELSKTLAEKITK